MKNFFGVFTDPISEYVEFTLPYLFEEDAESDSAIISEFSEVAHEL